MAAGMYLLLFLICLSSHAAWAHIPAVRYDNWAEPDAKTYAVNSERSEQSRQTALQRLAALRQVMAAYRVDAYIVPTGDAHDNQYISEADARREWLSGLSGSSGTALVTSEFALVWTDARYFAQFYMQVDTDHWQLMRQGTDLSLTAWLSQNMGNGSVVALDPTTYTRSAWTPLKTALSAVNIRVEAVADNLVDLARVAVGDPPPQRNNNPLITHSLQYTGKLSREKISDLLNQMNARGAMALVLTALDDIAYTLNLRGSDIPYNPVFFAYLVIRTDVAVPDNVALFWGEGVLTTDVNAHLRAEGAAPVTRPYGDIFDHLRNMTSTLPVGSTVWLPDDASHAVFSALEEGGSLNLLSTLSPVALTKYIKNDVELAGFRRAHVKDGTALVRFWRWLHEEVDRGRNVTEIDVVDKLYELRAEEEDFMGASFSTIAGAGEHGAVIHYSPDREGVLRAIEREDTLLVDSGGQYRDGTTDITRTRHMGSPTAAQRRAFTRVLKGQILLGTAVFPRGIVGHRLETLARKALWDVGLDYAHGTGHGVGQFLNVHEGPSWILSGPAAGDPGIQPGVVFSNEPGYYEEGEYGIRHEDLVETILLDKDSDHIQAAGLVGDFSGAGALGFRYLSLAPQQRACIDVDLLTDFELQFLNDYHARVLSTLGPVLLARGLTADHDWLQAECAPITRSAANTAIVAPVLILIGVFSALSR